MSQHQNNKEYLAAYSSFSPYQYNNPHHYFANQNSAQQENQPKQLQYSISNLPIIYDSNYRQATPSKASSRLVIDTREPALKEVNSSPVLKYEDPYQSKIYSEVNNRSRQVFVQTRPEFSTRLAVPTNQVFIPVPMPETKKQQEYRENPYQPQKNIVHSNTPYNIQRSQAYYKVLSQVPTSNNNVQSVGQQTNLQIPKNVKYIPVYADNFPHKGMVGQAQNNLTFNGLEPIKKEGGRQLQNARQSFSQLSTESVPKIQYDKCVNECKNWETKYNELYLKYMNLATKASQANTEQVEELRKQNYELRMQLKQQSQKNERMVPKLQAKFVEMVNSQKEATIRECTLLVERLKLQLKQHKF